MAITLMSKTTLSFTRDDPNNKGAFDISGKWVEASSISFDADGSLQPYIKISNGEERHIQQHGYSASDTRIFYTQTKIVTLNQFSGVKPDQTTIDGLTYDAFSIKDWNISGLQCSHYKVLLARKDLSSGV